MNSSEVRHYLWNFLRNKGLPENSTAAVMGNIYVESDGFKIDVEEYSGGGGYGLCQWTGSRRTQLESYGISFSHQLYFLWSELTGENLSTTNASFQWIEKSGYLSHDDFMEGNGTIEELTNAFCFCWERPNFELSAIDVRVEKANDYYDEYATGEEPDEPNPEPPEPEPEEPPTGGEVYADIEKTSYNVNKISEEQKELLKSLSYNDVIKLKYSFQKNKNILGHTPTNKRLTLDDKEYIIYSVRNDGLVDVGIDENVSTHKYIDCRFIIPTEQPIDEEIEEESEEE